MRKPIHVPPPKDFEHFSPSELFRFFFQLGRWTDDSFSDALQDFTRGRLVSTVTISKWKNKNVIPTRYSGPFLNLIGSLMEADLAKEWTAAFETVWALQSSGRKHAQRVERASPVSDTVCTQHQNWIRQIYSETSSANLFSIADMYVPLQLYNVDQNTQAPLDIEDIFSTFLKTDMTLAGSGWMFISGGPGSGKSMAALHLAQWLCEEDVFPIYLRGNQLTDIDIDIVDPDQMIADSFSAGSFLKHFRASSFESACIILDGIDDIGWTETARAESLGRLLARLQIEQSVCAAHYKSLRVIAFGRNSYIRFATNSFGGTEYVHLNMLGLDGRCQNQRQGAEIQGADLRTAWWERYLSASGKAPDPSLPDFLSTEYDDFSEFGTDPSLAYLICEGAFGNSPNGHSKSLPHERVNALTYSSNKNEMYRTIINHLALNADNALTESQFFSVLQHMALVIWQSPDSRSTTIADIYNKVTDEATKAAYRSLNLSDTSQLAALDMLITAFAYNRSSQDPKSANKAIEFTHKDFGDYLVSIVILDRFLKLISNFDNAHEYETSLKEWDALSFAGLHSASLAGFCQREAALRFSSMSNMNWDVALTILKDRLDGRGNNTNNFSSITQHKRSFSLFFFIWSCLNLERQKRTNSHFPLSQSSASFYPKDLKSIQIPNALNIDSGSLLEPLMQHQTFLTPSLSALRLTSADLSQLSFSLGHMEAPLFEDCSFAMTHWSHVKVSNGQFNRSVFQQAIFHQLQMLDTQFPDCLFQGSKFQGSIFSSCQLTDTYFSQCHFSESEFNNCNFDNVLFDRCVFTQSAFSHLTNPDFLKSVRFRHCTFIDMETSFNVIPSESIEAPVLQSEDRT